MTEMNEAAPMTDRTPSDRCEPGAGGTAGQVGATVAPTGESAERGDGSPGVALIRNAFAAPAVHRPGAGGSGEGEPDARWERHRRSCERGKASLERLGRASAAHPCRQRELLAGLAKSSDFRRLAAGKSARLRREKRQRKRFREGRPPEPPLTFEQITELAESIDVTKVSGEEVRIRGLAKPDGGVRPIVSFCDRDHAAQTAVRLLVEANVGGFNTSYADPYDALDTLALGIEAGLTHAVTFDIVNAYSTLKPAALPSICAISREM